MRVLRSEIKVFENLAQVQNYLNELAKFEEEIDGSFEITRFEEIEALTSEDKMDLLDNYSKEYIQKNKYCLKVIFDDFDE